MTSNSSTEAKVVAHGEMLMKSALPTLSLFEEYFERGLQLLGQIDNDAAKLACVTGSSKTLR